MRYFKIFDTHDEFENDKFNLPESFIIYDNSYLYFNSVPTVHHKQSDNVIKYTTVNNKVLYSFANYTFLNKNGSIANIVSNIYDNNEGIIKFDKDVNIIPSISFSKLCNDINMLYSISLPNSVTSIGNGVFSKCVSLKFIDISNSVISIGDYAFEGCINLASIIIPNSVTKIGINTFNGCSSLTSIEIPNNVTKIGANAFYGCSSLTSLIIHENVTSIGDHAFDRCTNLTSIEIPNSVTSIGEYAFYCCSSLTSIEIPEGVISIGDYAFCGCSSLTSLIIPESVTNIGDYAFDENISVINNSNAEYVIGSVYSNKIINVSNTGVITLDDTSVINFTNENIISNEGRYHIQYTVKVTNKGNYIYDEITWITSVNIAPLVNKSDIDIDEHIRLDITEPELAYGYYNCAVYTDASNFYTIINTDNMGRSVIDIVGIKCIGYYYGNVSINIKEIVEKYPNVLQEDSTIIINDYPYHYN